MESGAIAVQPDLLVLGTGKRLRIHPQHELKVDSLCYRALRYSFAATR
jgi:hypothetical protein